MSLAMPAYVYRSEGQNGRITFIATCPFHGRDLSIHPSRAAVEKVVSAHGRLFHE